MPKTYTEQQPRITVDPEWVGFIDDPNDQSSPLIPETPDIADAYQKALLAEQQLINEETQGSMELEEIRLLAIERLTEKIKGETVAGSAAPALPQLTKDREGTTNVWYENRDGSPSAFTQAYKRQAWMGDSALPWELKKDSDVEYLAEQWREEGLAEEQITLRTKIIEQQFKDAREDLDWFSEWFAEPLMNIKTGQVGIYENNTMRAFRALNVASAFLSEAVQETGMGFADMLNSLVGDNSREEAYKRAERFGLTPRKILFGKRTSADAIMSLMAGL